MKKEELKQLKKDIGFKLYNRLSKEDRDFMIETASSIDFGHPIDLDKVAQDIKNYEM